MDLGERVPAHLVATLPRLFGPYLLVERLAEGGMGEVYLAKHRRADGGEDFCVVKKLLPKLLGDREYVTRFIDEARIVVTLEQKNIAETFDVGKVDGEIYLAMEYIAGLDLRALLQRAEAQDAVLPVPATLHIACELLAALDYAHKRRHPITDEPLHLVHRDVSPQNVIVGFDNRVMLIDFGLASSRLKIEKTEPNVVMGKMAYMSPEQAKGNVTDARTDQFAVAVMLYEMLSGERFYAGMSPLDVFNVVGKGTFRPRRFDAIDPKLRDAIDRALQKNPDARFPDAARFRKVLLSNLHGRFAESGEVALERTVRALAERDLVDDWQRLLDADDVSVASFAEEFRANERSTSSAMSETLAQSLLHESDHDALEGSRTDDDLALLIPDRARRTHGEQTRVTLDAKLRAQGVDPTQIVRDRRPLEVRDPTVVVRDRAKSLPALGGLPSRPASGSHEIVRMVSILDPNQRQERAWAVPFFVGLGLALIIAIAAAVALTFGSR
jgi:serine/threonine protein kinase